MKYGVLVPNASTGKADRAAAVFGPERWQTTAGVDWSYWDLWFCTICVVDHAGDWDALDTAIQNTDTYQAEAKWSHLLDLTERLNDAGLTAATLVGGLADDRKLRTKARTKVMKSHLYERDITPAMVNRPSTRLRRRALVGCWPDFPRSPQPWYDKLSARFEITELPCWKAGVTRDTAHEIAEVERDLAKRAANDPAMQLAVRRAALSLYYELAELCDDSYGGLGMVAGDAIEAYARADWRASGITPEVFWRDFLQWCIMASNYGLLFEAEDKTLRRCGVKQNLDLVEAILVDLAAEYTTARMRHHGDEAMQLQAYAVVAAGLVSRFESTAAAIGSHSWLALNTMVEAAVKRNRVDIAARLLDAADVPGTHQGWVRERRAKLTASS